jgi:Mg2+/citrate symporter
MRIIKIGLMLLAATALLSSAGCGVSEDRHIAELEQQAKRYEQQLMEQRQQHKNEAKRKNVWFAIIIVANNLGWFLACRKRS